MQFTALPRLQALLHEKTARYLLNPIDGNGLKDVVRAPAKLAGLRWSDDLLPDEIVQEARDEPGALPLVENLLRLLWLENRNTQNNTLSRQVYNNLGGVGGALAKSADALLESLGDGKQKALNLLTALVNVGGQSEDIQDTRRTISKSVALQAAGGGTQAESILNQLSGLRGLDTSRGAPARPRLVVLSTVTREGASTDLVDLAHETLLRYDRNKQPYWGTLRAEITTRREAIENRQLAEVLAKEWHKHGSSRWSGLAPRAQRKAFKRLRDLSGDAAAYVQASLRFAKRVTWSLAIVMVLLILSASFVTWTVSQGTTPLMMAKLLLTRVGLDVLSPAMKKVETKEFKMGDSKDSGSNDERPVHNVNIKQPFAIGLYEVTFEEYDLFAALTEKELPNDSGWDRGRQPVINVSWEDAVAYAKWLSQVTGKRYRLPTEAELQYAARSGETDNIWEGISDESHLKDYAVYRAERTEPVGGKKPNGLGLYDMSGNVWEWVEDCWHDNYKDAPSDGLVWREAGGGDCSRRVVRGGSWNSFLGTLRVSPRSGRLAGYRFNDIGFRLVQDLP